MRKTGFVYAMALSLAGCTGTLAGGAGDVGGGDDLGSAEQALTLDATEAIQIAAILGYELSGLLEDVPGLSEDGAPMPGPSGSVPVGTADCTEVDWDAAAITGITVTFDECVLDDGRVLDGGVGVRLEGALSGVVTVDLMDLAIGDRFITGTVTLSISASDVQVDAELDYLDADTIMGIELAAVRMGIRGDGVHFDGEATVVKDGLPMSLTLNDVTWSLGNLCHPSAGSVDLTRAGEPPMSILFSPSGVTLQVGADEPVSIPGFC